MKIVHFFALFYQNTLFISFDHAMFFCQCTIGTIMVTAVESFPIFLFCEKVPKTQKQEK